MGNKTKKKHMLWDSTWCIPYIYPKIRSRELGEPTREVLVWVFPFLSTISLGFYYRPLFLVVFPLGKKLDGVRILG